MKILKFNERTELDKIDDEIIDDVKQTKLDGEWEIISVIEVSTHEPITNEAIVINAEVGNKPIKRGEYIYITCQIKRAGQSELYHHSQMGVIKTRVTDIFNTMQVLNTLK